IVIATPQGLDFDALQLRLHPAASRVAKLARETPASFVAFDLIAAGGEDLCAAPLRERRARLEALLANAAPPLHLTPATRDRQHAVDGWRSSRVPASTASSPNWKTARTSRGSARCSRSSTRGPPTAL